MKFRRWLPIILQRGSGVTVPAAPPTTLTNQVLWLRADAGLYQDTAATTPVTADGQGVKLWLDQFGLGNSPTEVTNAPTYKVNIQNGLPVLRFDGTNDKLRKTYAVAKTQPVTLYIALASSTNVRWAYDGIVNAFYLFSGDGSNNWGMSAGSNNNFGMFTGFNVLTIIYNGSFSLVRKNGAAFAPSLTCGTNTMDGLSVGCRLTNASFLNGDIGEIIIYNAAHSTTQFDIIEPYLLDRWIP